ncbi:phosphoserine phosphatase SerB [Simiduia curdlanivorans]|uniref:Phosphoserine phosphatase n=1 Tax=Simiduia curdlanivorans TaxID=1492769 RepID=A0ABV8V339_9GAMM|nr:phosphoserine phosphatase SerB [Simiduia curdlanivorans]MDN3637635.1 phosphoserine phosphatase SerB [Simiduia curdlanivorans]
MASLVLTSYKNNPTLVQVLSQLDQLPLSWHELAVRPGVEGFVITARCDAPVDARAIQESIAELLPDVQVQVSDSASPACDYVMTLMATDLRPRHLNAVLAKLATLGLQLQTSRSLSHASDRPRKAWQLRLTGTTDLKLARVSLLELADNLGIDISLQPRADFAKQAGLICFDMDSTLIKAECIDELAREAGIGEQVAAITASAMRGDIDFIESFTKRMALLNGLPETVLAGIAHKLEFMDGAQVLINTLKARGFHTAILSGGFVYFAQYVQQRLGIDEIHANELEIIDGKVTGRVTGTVVDGKRKAELIQMLAAKRGLNMAQVIAVGDGANDLPMLGLAGLGVAIHAKPLVRASADYAISQLGLDALCYLLGLDDDDIMDAR